MLTGKNNGSARGLLETTAGVWLSADDLLIAEWRQHSPLFGEDVRAAVTPLASVMKKQTPQSTAPGAVAAALAEMREWLART